MGHGWDMDGHDGFSVCIASRASIKRRIVSRVSIKRRIVSRARAM